MVVVGGGFPRPRESTKVENFSSECFPPTIAVFLSFSIIHSGSGHR